MSTAAGGNIRTQLITRSNLVGGSLSHRASLWRWYFINALCVDVIMTSIVQMVDPSGWRPHLTANWVCHRVTPRQYRTVPSLRLACRRPPPTRSILIIGPSNSSSNIVIRSSTVSLYTPELQLLNSARNVPTGYDYVRNKSVNKTMIGLCIYMGDEED